MGRPRWITADVVDAIGNGLGITLMAALQPGATILVSGRSASTGETAQRKASVRWCLERADGSYRAGLEFLDVPAEGPQSPPNPESSAPPPQESPDSLDCYEILQLSPNATPDTISRVYRLLAARYHPDNAETGDPELFLQLSQAYQVLSDPHRRAAYDAAYQASRKLRWKIFDSAAASFGPAAEIKKRTAILGLLYARMLHDPRDPEVTIHLLEDLLGVPKEHLEAALWFLKGKDFIRRGDNGRYSITIAGFEEAEAHSAALPSPAPQLPAPDLPPPDRRANSSASSCCLSSNQYIPEEIATRSSVSWISHPHPFQTHWTPL
jgi:curved DNA-binding protein CbpA